LLEELLPALQYKFGGKKMAVKPRRKLLTIISIALITFCTYAYTLPSVQASEISIQQKGIAITKSVMDIDIAKYSATSEYKQDSYLGVLPQENLRYTLEAQETKIDLYYSFVIGKLQKIHVLEVKGTPQTKKALATNMLEMAKDFLTNYQEYTKNPFFIELKSMLDNVNTNKNSTAITGNTKLAVAVQDDSATFKWTYTFNGMDAPDKCVALRYEDGFLSYFIDSWDLYKIGNTSVNISEQQAIDIAIAQAKNFTWIVTVDNKTTYEGLKYNVTNAMVWETVFANSVYMDNPRGQDPLMLYPVRHIWVSFDKFYPYSVYGMNVYVWADTGEIGHMQERFSTMDPPADLVATVDDIIMLATDNHATTINKEQSYSMPIILIVLPAFAVLMLGTVTIYLGKKSLPRTPSLHRSHALKIGGILLCFLMASTVLFVVVLAPTVDALPVHGRATVWGSESSGAWWRKAPWEISRQQATASFIRSEFDQNGYSASNYQGSNGLGSYKNTILAQIDSNEASFPRVAVVDFNHGNWRTDNPSWPIGERHYMFEDQIGVYTGPDFHNPGPPHHENLVYDAEIATRTFREKTFFVLINACNSAHVEEGYQGLNNGRAQGMPYAWTHRLVRYKYQPGFTETLHISDDGYARPDNGKFVYLGFNYGSAALSQTIQGTTPYWHWLEHFFAYALRNNWSVRQALNEASQQFFSCNFDQTTFGGTQGFIASWPMYKDGSWQEIYPPEQRRGWLKVYGNSNLKLYQPSVTLRSRDYSNDNLIYPITITLDGESIGTNLKLVPKVYSVYASDIPGYHFSHYTYKGYNYYNRQSNILLDADGELTAYYTWVPYIIIESVYGGTTNPPPGYYEGSGVQTIYAYANQGYHLDHWKLNGNYLCGPENPIYVDYNNWWTVTPVFVPDQPINHNINVHAVDTYFNYGQPLTVSVWVDGNWRGYSFENIIVEEGYHTIEVDAWVDDPVLGWIPFYYWTDEYWNVISYYDPSLYTYVSADLTVVAWYDAGYWGMAPEGMTPELFLQLKGLGLK
jgi:hypothetical protein